MADARPVGKTQSVGYQFGVRRAFDGSADAAWALLVSPRGIREWLGGSGRVRLEAGKSYRLADGTTGEVRVWKPGEVVRVTWHPPGWPRPSTIQIRVLPRANGRCAIAFHHEWLPDAAAREAVRERWGRVLDALAHRA